MSRIDGTIKWLRRRGCKIPSFDKVLRADYEIQEKEIEQLRNKVSELTEALDASHVFCESVKEHYIKAIEEAYNKMLHNGTILITKSQFVECFEKYMKGEYDGSNI